LRTVPEKILLREVAQGMFFLKKVFLPGLAACLFMLNCNSCCLAQEVEFPSPRGYVNDYAGVLSAQTAQHIDSLCRQVESKTTAQIAVLIVRSTKPLEIEQYAVEIFEKWGIGSKDKDNGLLLLVAIDDRSVRIETGYGLEGAIPDAIASNIIYQTIIPEFKQARYERGLLMAMLSIADIIAGEYNVSLDLSEDLSGIRASQEEEASPLTIFITIIFFIIIFGMRSGLLFYFILGSAGRRRGGYWYGSGMGGSRGGFGGGFGGFGGGFSGGGGATGRW
jgi:uncharacterized protein